MHPQVGEPLRPSYHVSTSVNYTGYRGTNRVFGCFGASLAAWDAFGTRYGYHIVSTRGNNALLVRADAARRARTRHALRDNPSVWCHAAQTHSQNSRLGMQRPPGIPPPDGLGKLREPAGRHPHQQWRAGGSYDYTGAARHIGRSCAETQTPFRLSVPGRCCPAEAQQVPLRLPIGNVARPLCRGCDPVEGAAITSQRGGE